MLSCQYAKQRYSSVNDAVFSSSNRLETSVYLIKRSGEDAVLHSDRKHYHGCQERNTEISTSYHRLLVTFGQDQQIAQIFARQQQHHLVPGELIQLGTGKLLHATHVIVILKLILIDHTAIPKTNSSLPAARPIRPGPKTPCGGTVDSLKLTTFNQLIKQLPNRSRSHPRHPRA